MLDFLQALRRLDRSRPSLPGEHWVTFAIGLRYLLRQRRGMLGSIGSKAFGLTLIGRALSGRDGAVAMLRRTALPPSKGGRFVDVASPWPHDRRVSIDADSDGTRAL